MSGDEFFFFEQKTAYEVRLSLVGSEMCIRGRLAAENGDGHTPRALAELNHRPEAIRALLRPPAAAEGEEVKEELEQEPQFVMRPAVPTQASAVRSAPVPYTHPTLPTKRIG